MQNLAAGSHTVRAHVGGPKNCGTLGPHLWMKGREWPARNTSIPTCYLANLVALGQIYMGSQKLGTLGPRPLRWGRGWSLKIRPPRLDYRAKFGHSRSHDTNVIMDICQKSLTLRVPPFKATQGQWNRHESIGCLWLPFLLVTHSNHGPAILVENRKFSYHMVFNSEGFPLEFCNSSGAQKTREMPLP